MKSKKGSGTSFIEEQYFGEIEKIESSDNAKDLNNNSDNSFIEDQYFGKNVDTNFPFPPGKSENNNQDEQFSVEKSDTGVKAPVSIPVTNKNFSFIDEEFFGNKPSGQVDLDMKSSNSDDHFNSEFFKNVFKHKQGRLTAEEEDEQIEDELPEQASSSPFSPKLDAPKHVASELDAPKHVASELDAPKHVASKLDAPKHVTSELDAPKHVASKLDPLEFARQQQQKDEELVAPQEEGEGALATEQVPALDFALAFRRTTGINQNLIPGQSFYQRYFRAEKPFLERKKTPQDSYEALEMEALEEEKRRSRETKFVPVDVTPPWSIMTNWEVLNFLKKLVIYEDDDILALNKPYGLTCQGGGRDLFSLLPDLSEALRLRQPLLPLHRLDAGTTGAILLAKHEEAARRVKQQFARRQVFKRYVAVVTGVPRERRGVVSTPIAQLFDPIHNVTKSVLVPSDEMTSIRRGPRELRLTERKNAETAYEVVVSKHRTSLLVCEPSTGVRHQLRVHLADGLGCPVLGDHKYSSAVGKKPQRVARAMEQHLAMDRSKARHFMLHLHCLGLSLAEQEPLAIYAKPHTFFLKTLNRLGIVLPNFLRRMRPLI